MASHAEYPAKVSGDYRSLLLELTISYLIEQPPDCVDFAIDFLNQKRRERLAGVKSATLDEPEDPCDDIVFTRRETVFAGSFDPEEMDDVEEILVEPKTLALKKKLSRILTELFIFKHLDEEEINRVIERMQRKLVHKGDVIIKQGDEGDFFYLVESGEFQAYLDDGLNKKVLRVYENEGSFGELSLIYNEPRACYVKAMTDGELWQIDTHTFRKVVVGSSFNKRKILDGFLSKVPYLQTLNEEERMILVDTLFTRGYQPGQKIFSEGEVADGMYFLLEGTITLTVKDGRGIEKELKKLHRGDYFGELALLTYSPRAASAYASDVVLAAFLNVEAFERLLGSCRKLMKRNAELYSQELTKIHENDIRSIHDFR